MTAEMSSRPRPQQSSPIEVLRDASFPLSPNRKAALRRSFFRSELGCVDQAAFRFLRLARKPIMPKPVTKSENAAGGGVAATELPLKVKLSSAEPNVGLFPAMVTEVISCEELRKPKKLRPVVPEKFCDDNKPEEEKIFTVKSPIRLFASKPNADCAWSKVVVSTRGPVTESRKPPTYPPPASRGADFAAVEGRVQRTVETCAGISCRARAGVASAVGNPCEISAREPEPYRARATGSPKGHW
jgi:hypothetical protein